MSFDFKSAGIDKAIAAFRVLPEQSAIMASQSINKGITMGRTDAARRLLTEIAFPASYLGSPSDQRGRLRIAQKATKSDLKASISARVIPTSLARFAIGNTKGRNVRVKVKGSSSGKFIPGAFTVRLRSGASITEDSYNVGLAIRVPKGQTLSGSRAARQLAPNLYLLYGPSVAQAFNVIIEKQDFSAQTAVIVRNEYLRLLQLRGAK